MWTMYAGYVCAFVLALGAAICLDTPWWLPAALEGYVTFAPILAVGLSIGLVPRPQPRMKKAIGKSFQMGKLSRWGVFARGLIVGFLTLGATLAVWFWLGPAGESSIVLAMALVVLILTVFPIAGFAWLVGICDKHLRMK
jgi:hypothetical protein